jgi:dehydrogenase/reductase SDR family member 12
MGKRVSPLLDAASRRAADAVLEATVVLGFSKVGYRARRTLFGWQDGVAGVLTGRVAVVTGATGGLGTAITTELARLGATVWMLGRDRSRTSVVADSIARRIPGADLRVAVVDLTRLSDVHEGAELLATHTQRLDILIHNAGVLMSDYRVTDEGVEHTAATQLVGPFLLTWSLFQLLRSTPGSRVITVSSGGMYAQRLDVSALDPNPATFRGITAYSRTKRAQVVLNQEWARRTSGSGVTFQAMHPGWVATPGLTASLPGFARLMGPLLRSPSEGVDTIVWLASSAQASRSNGEFWHDRRRRSTVRLPGTSTPAGEAARLWTWAVSRSGLPVYPGATP